MPLRLGPGAPAWELADDTHPLHASQAPGPPLLPHTLPPGSSRPAGWAVSCLLHPLPRKHKARMLFLERFSLYPAEGTHSHLQRLVEGVFPLGKDRVLGGGGSSGLGGSLSDLAVPAAASSSGQHSTLWSLAFFVFPPLSDFSGSSSHGVVRSHLFRKIKHLGERHQLSDSKSRVVDIETVVEEIDF